MSYTVIYIGLVFKIRPLVTQLAMDIGLRAGEGSGERPVKLRLDSGDSRVESRIEGRVEFYTCAATLFC